jgi:DNA-binding MarR family transcriptional regulator
MRLSFEYATIDYANKCSRRKMSSQVLSEQSSAVRSFTALLRAQASATRRLSAQLSADHGLTISDYEVLLRLAHAPDRRMRRVDLAEQVLLTASGITRLLDGLERSGFVERAACATDRRVVYAVLTDEGLEKLRTASPSHVRQIDEFFTERLGPEELEGLAGLLEKFGGQSESCTPDD